MRGKLKLTVQKSSPKGPIVCILHAEGTSLEKHGRERDLGTYWLRELVSFILLLFRWESTEECRLQNGRIFALVKNANTRPTRYFWAWRSRASQVGIHTKSRKSRRRFTPCEQRFREEKNQLFCRLTPMLRFYQLSWQGKFPAVKEI